MKSFNYRDYLQDNYLLKEAKEHGPATRSDLKGFATKDSTLNREKRAEEGNWRGSLGEFVEKHGPEIQQAVDSRSLVSYVENTMMPALGPEAQEYLDDLISRSRSDAQLLFSIYNATLKGSGMGLHESAESKNISDEYLEDIMIRGDRIALSHYGYQWGVPFDEMPDEDIEELRNLMTGDPKKDVMRYVDWMVDKDDSYSDE